MLVFKRDISKRETGPLPEGLSEEEAKYESYHRKLFPYTIVRGGLDLAYKEMDDMMDYVENDHTPPAGSSRRDFPADIPAWYRSRFPWSANFLSMEETHSALVIMAKAMDSFGTREKMKTIHWMVLYDCVHFIVDLYNKLLEDSADKARDINLSNGVAVDFDDFINQYWFDIDFALLSKPDYPHQVHAERKGEIEYWVDDLMIDGTEPLKAMEEAAREFKLDPATQALLRRDPVTPQMLELESVRL
ncbi:MAG: hypothetical protein G3M78_05115 [Candidatus Nitrohelix vancouverensis]|uniref:Uncharacterized protein n=1 Tax=Candidatus Nitrohelix vancouverensis TaxID=2705534 RepID=A0A7T0G322_9BACT|nr:MAG: hypothetical protein G3M78_05115 [Candidatus Nitrohelix vancouverensis]